MSIDLIRDSSRRRFTRGLRHVQIQLKLDLLGEPPKNTQIPSPSTPPMTPVSLRASSPYRSKRNILPEKPQIRRTPSKVPGDYDPVTGYYRRKSDADLRMDDGVD